MNAPGRQELDAKLEVIETRMDARVAASISRMDAVIARMDERDKLMDERDKRMDERDMRWEARMTAMDLRYGEHFKFLEREHAALIGEIRSLKRTTIITAITASLAIVFGVATFNAALLANMGASYNSGREAAATFAEVRRQQQEVDVLLKRANERLDLLERRDAGKQIQP